MEEPSSKSLRKRKPFRLLAKMEKEEIDLFRHFLVSPLVNPKADKKLVEFFDHCRSIRLWEIEIDKSGFEKKAGWKLADNAFDKLVSKLYAALTTFAGLIEFLADGNQHAQFALKFYDKKGFEQEEIGKKVKEGKRELSNTDQDEEYFRLMLKLELESAERARSRTLSPEERGFVQLHGHLDSYFLILKLRFICASINEQYIYGDGGVTVTYELLIEWFTAMYPQMPALAQIYYHAFHVLKGIDDEVHVLEFQQRLSKWEGTGTRIYNKEFAELNGYLLNYYSFKLNSGESDALPKVHHFYMEGLKKGWILEEGKISPEHFKNIVITYCRMGLLSDAKGFFQQFKHELTNDQSGAAMNYNEAVLIYYERDYQSFIPKIEALIESKGGLKTDHHYGIDMRCMLLKACFEYLAEANWEVHDTIDEKLTSLLHAFPAYIARKNLSRTTQLRFDNFRKSLHRLYTIVYVLPESERMQKMKELLLEFRSSSNLPDKAWFIQKASAFSQ